MDWQTMREKSMYFLQCTGKGSVKRYDQNRKKKTMAWVVGKGLIGLALPKPTLNQRKSDQTARCRGFLFLMILVPTTV